MKLKVAELLHACTTLVGIINAKRTMPVKGQYRLARMHEQLMPEFKAASTQRDALVMEFGEDEMVDPPKTAENPTGQGPQVPTGNKLVKPTSPKWAEYFAAWEKLAGDEIEVNVQPIPLSLLDNIEAGEFIALGALVVDE